MVVDCSSVGEIHTKTYFIADVHLETDDIQKRDMFLKFVSMVQYTGGDLFILGDLFDYWANNRKVKGDNHLVLDALRRLTCDGAQVTFIIGNRDLLLGARSLTPYGIAFGGECKRIMLQGKQLLLTHGHLLCTNDREFQRYRRTAWPLYRLLDAVLPGVIENALARKFMMKNKKVIALQEPWRLCFSDAAIHQAFAQGVEVIICGHSHQALMKTYGDKYFVVLPSWTSERGGYLLMEGGYLQLMDFLEGTKVNA